MAFVPIRGLPLDPPGGDETAPSRPPGRGDRPIHPPAGSGSALAWRALVHAGNRDAIRTEWHLVACLAPREASAHCPVGQGLLETMGDPDGHCIVGERCPRCDEQH